MGKFIQKDDAKQLGNVHHDLLRIINAVVAKADFDCIVVYGYRTPEEQAALYAIGRTKPGSIVTNCDGKKVKSQHNYLPSFAVDIAPAEIVATGKWKETPDILQKFYQLGLMAEAEAKRLGIKDYRWGGRFSFKDRPHHELNRRV